jgi:hypothetical protein
MNQSWVSSIVGFFKNLVASLVAYFLGKKSAEADQAKKNLEIVKTYEQIDEQNKPYHDDGKSGLLKRLRDFEDSDSK